MTMLPDLAACQARSGTLNLVGEKVMTRTAITPDTIETYAPAIALSDGAGLTRVIGAWKIAPSSETRFELRFRLKLTCGNGGSHVILGSRTQPDGTVFLSVDGVVGTTHDPVRRELEALASAAH